MLKLTTCHCRSQCHLKYHNLIQGMDGIFESPSPEFCRNYLGSLWMDGLILNLVVDLSVNPIYLWFYFLYMGHTLLYLFQLLSNINLFHVTTIFGYMEWERNQHYWHVFYSLWNLHTNLFYNISQYLNFLSSRSQYIVIFLISTLKTPITLEKNIYMIPLILQTFITYSLNFSRASEVVNYSLEPRNIIIKLVRKIQCFFYIWDKLWRPTALACLNDFGCWPVSTYT